MASYRQPLYIIIAVQVLPITIISSDEIDHRKISCSAIPCVVICSTSISEDIQAVQNPTCQAEEEISLDNIDLWSFFKLGNGSPDPNNMTNPNPNYPREVCNLELQNYDTHSINREEISSDGSISIRHLYEILQ